MPSTASKWIEESDYAAERLDEMLAASGVPLDVLTEYPLWMKKEIAARLKETFEQPYWDDIAATFQGDAEKFLKRGLRDGWSIRKIAEQMAMDLGGGKYAKTRAVNIARTESGNALNGARKAGMDKMMAELGPEMQGVMRPTWLSVLGSTTRDTHANLDGVPADKDGMWTLAGYRIPWPGHISLPASERCNCFPAGVLVSGDFTGAYRVWYDGIIAEIVTVAGTRLSVTPNHPVMTLDGFVPACQLKPGQKIVAHRLQVDDGIQLTAGEILGHSQVGVCDKVQNKPVPVEQVFEAFRATSVPVEVKPAEMNDFYGDGQFMPGDIEIVRPDWELLSNGVSSTLEKHGDFVFALVDRELQLIFGLGSGNSSGDGITVSPPSSPCLAEPLLCVPIGRITPSGSLAVGVASDFNPPLLKTSRKNRPGIAAFLRDSLKGDSGLVFLDEVVEIRYFEASHWVYDLQSVRGVIVAGNALYTDNALPKIGIVTSNCQCSIVMSFGLQDPEAEQMIDQYNQRVEEYEQGIAEQEDAKSVKHLPGQHNQLSHGGGGSMAPDTGGNMLGGGAGGGGRSNPFEIVVPHKDRFPSVSDDLPPGGEYEYHATPAGRLEKIVGEGLKASPGSSISVAPHLEAADFWGSMVGDENIPSKQPILLRMKRARVRHGSLDDDGSLSYEETPELDMDPTREHVVTRSVPPGDLEVYFAGEWSPLSGLLKSVKHLPGQHNQLSHGRGGSSPDTGGDAGGGGGSVSKQKFDVDC